MKKLLALLLTVPLLLSGCSLAKLNAIDYNNRIVEQINATSEVLEESAALYNEIIPEIVTEKTEIETEPMAASLENSRDAVEDSRGLLKLLSKNEEQLIATTDTLNLYLQTADLYLDEYDAMLTYYLSGTYKTSVSRVSDIDSDLHKAYTTFIEANNDLVDTLDSFVETSVENIDV